MGTAVHLPPRRNGKVDAIVYVLGGMGAMGTRMISPVAGFSRH